MKKIFFIILIIFSNPVIGKEGDLFFCFLDQTNSTSTYPGGRYIDIEFENAKRIELDFNKSYNPYCVYNEEYSCPIPTRENYIDMEILAGEKLTK